MTAKDSLLKTLAVLDDCLTNATLIDSAPGDIAHNERARMLRQGLAVLIFSTVESFFRERTAEILRSLSNPTLEFNDLSPALQRATTIGALEGVRFRLKLQPASSKVSWLVANLAPISGAISNVRNLSDHSFGFSSSNIEEDDVRDILKAFGIEAPWAQVTAVTKRTGLTILDAEAEFQAMKKRRHSSAHALSGHVLYADLQNSVRSALSICIAFDLLLSHARGLLNLKAGFGTNSRALMKHADVELVFVQPKANTNLFSVRLEQLPPPAPVHHRATIRNFAELAHATAYGLQYARARRRQLVILSQAFRPVNWDVW